MSDLLTIKKSTCQSIADAIRGCTGSTAKIHGCDFDNHIRAIPVGNTDIEAGILAIFNDTVTSFESENVLLLKSIFNNMASLEYIHVPNITQTAQAALAGTSITSFIAPKLVIVGQYTFRDCVKLEYVDIQGQQKNRLSSTVFNNCTALKTLVIRATDGVVGLSTNSSTGGLSDTKIAAGEGYIYVPRALKDGYEAHESWVTWATQFRALEDYTVDGTVTGALDMTKI